jgi:phosphoribosylaminoimidazole (AIR) synthetase
VTCQAAFCRCAGTLATALLHAQGVVHITGGGFPENIPRIVPTGKDLGFRIRTEAWEVPPLFRWLQQARPIRRP